MAANTEIRPRIGGRHAQLVAAEAKRTGRSQTQIINELIDTYLSDRPRPRTGLGASGDPDLARNTRKAMRRFGSAR